MKKTYLAIIRWEIMGVCSYSLIGFFYDDPKSARAGIKAFLTTKLGDIGLFASILILYKFSNTFLIDQNIQYAHQLPAAVLTMVSIGFIMGAVGKSAQVRMYGFPTPWKRLRPYQL